MAIRQATMKDLSRIAEILVFVKRLNFRPIFQDDSYSFGELQVLTVAQQYSDPALLSHIWVYEDEGIVKGLIHIDGEEVKTLYVDSFFQNQGIGAKLLDWGKEHFPLRFLWAIEKNSGALRFYAAHGFFPSGEKKFEEGSTEYLLRLERRD